MPIITFDEADLLRRKIVTPGWYRVLITSVGQRNASGNNPQTSTVYPIEGKILKNADTGSTEFAGVPTPSNWMMNDNPNAKEIFASFFEALGAEIKPGTRLELQAAEGKELDVYIANDTWDGRVVNRVKPQYRRAKPDTHRAA